ncbi:GNAT family N-acetyltransferase [Pedobacter gandavensis]|uniref:GNAT family N-acetyltransferase n=1 Tax=Pedobacter gandavensis TaxID=2679963 RepID=A0ABR6EQ68_9SPHI|nr:GNAT family N-acetyltransferase [Pedobacter gandavensis]MBB2147337.1 GNAT family N-acetyltransferase [Pedobacter gandavensis]
MTAAPTKNRKFVQKILADAFEHNLSVNYIIKQDEKRFKRLANLMDYSFKVCSAYGKVLVSQDRKACALVLLPDKKLFSLKMMIWDLKLIFNVIGLKRLSKILRRDRMIKQTQPKMQKMYYLWFIGVDPMAQHQGLGTEMMEELIADARVMKRPIFLETSVLKNVSWYEHLGFRIYHELDLGYKLYFMKMET